MATSATISTGLPRPSRRCSSTSCPAPMGSWTPPHPPAGSGV